MLNRLRCQPGVRSRLTIDPDQYRDKNSYYDSLKTQLRSQPEARPKPWIEMVNLGLSEAI
jgi:hypothetical protein